MLYKNYESLEMQERFVEHLRQKEEEKIVLPKGIKETEDYEYYNCQMKEIVLPDGIEKISEGSFYGCSRLEKINFPKGLKRINSEAFKYCCSLKSIIIEDCEGLDALYAYIYKMKSLTREPPQWCSSELVISVHSPFEFSYNVKGYSIEAKDDYFHLRFKNNDDLFDLLSLSDFLKAPTYENFEKNAFTTRKAIIAMASCEQNRKIVDYFNQITDKSMSEVIEQAMDKRDVNTFNFFMEHGLINKKNIDQYIEMIIKANEDSKYDYPFLANVYVELVKHKSKELGEYGNADIAERFDL